MLLAHIRENGDGLVMLLIIMPSEKSLKAIITMITILPFIMETSESRTDGLIS